MNIHAGDEKQSGRGESSVDKPGTYVDMVIEDEIYRANQELEFGAGNQDGLWRSILESRLRELTLLKELWDDRKTGEV